MAEVGVDIHKNGFDLSVSIITFPRIGLLFSGKLAEGCCGLVVLDDVAWGDDIFKAIALGYLSAFLAFTSNNKNGVVFLDHLSHWRVPTDKLCRGNFNVELTGQVDAAFSFCLTTTVCEENIGTFDH